MNTTSTAAIGRNISLEIIIQVAEINIRSTSTYSEGAKWHLVHRFFHDSRNFNFRVLYPHWVHLDVTQGCPNFRIQSAIDGRFDVFENVSNVWKVSLDDRLGVKAALHDNSPLYSNAILNSSSKVSLTTATKDTSSHKPHGIISFPIFKSVADLNVYLDYTKALALTNDVPMGLNFLEILLILARNDGPFPVPNDSDPSSLPIFGLIDTFLNQFDVGNRPSFSRLVRRNGVWALCGLLPVSLHIAQRLWKYQLEDDEFTAASAEDAVLNKMHWIKEFCQGLFNHRIFKTHQSHFLEVIHWLCTFDGIRHLALPHIMLRCIEQQHSELFMYMLATYPNFAERDCRNMTELLEVCIVEQETTGRDTAILSDMLAQLQTIRPTNLVEPRNVWAMSLTPAHTLLSL